MSRSDVLRELARDRDRLQRILTAAVSAPPSERIDDILKIPIDPVITSTGNGNEPHFAFTPANAG